MTNQDETSTFLDNHLENTENRYLGAKSNAPNSANLTEAMIRYAHEHTHSNQQVAQLLHVDIRTLKKYAEKFIDQETGLNLWELQKLRGREKRKKLPKKKSILKGKYQRSIEDILAGKKVNYDRWTVLRRLLLEGYFAEECQRCGYNERRVTDYCVPLTLGFKDGNKKNFHIDNIEIVCLNCYYHYYGDSTLTLKDFRSYQAHYSDYIRKKIVQSGEMKYGQKEFDGTEHWGSELDVREDLNWLVRKRKYENKYYHTKLKKSSKNTDNSNINEE